MPRTCIGDNYAVRVIARGRDHFEMALSLAFNGEECRFYAVYPKAFGLVFFNWVTDSDKESGPILHELTEDFHYKDTSTPLEWTKPANPLCVGECLDLAWDWLVNQPEENYPLQEWGNDILYEKGFIITTGDVWGHVGQSHGTICSVRPEWMWLGK